MQKNKALAVGASVLLVAALYLTWKLGLIQRLSHHEALVQAMRRSGIYGPLICVGIQFVQVIIFLIPGEITQIAAGYVFGPWLGFAYSSAGILLGSAFNYSFARLVGRPVMEKLIDASRLERIDAALQTGKGKSALFLLFLLPGAPKDAMSYGAGLTRIGLGEFLVLSGLGRTPALLFSTIIGSHLYDRDYGALAITAVIGLLVILGFYLYERKRHAA